MDIFTLAALAIVAALVDSLAKTLFERSGAPKRIDESSSTGK